VPSVRVRGIDIYYEEHGSASYPCLIMAHGLLGSVAATPRFGERADDIAARGLHVVSYDARGHGRSGYTTRREDYRWAARGGPGRTDADARHRSRERTAGRWGRARRCCWRWRTRSGWSG
jgi:alpha-beta hydrolase superfamily lysophospholipase